MPFFVVLLQQVLITAMASSKLSFSFILVVLQISVTERATLKNGSEQFILMVRLNLTPDTFNLSRGDGTYST